MTNDEIRTFVEGQCCDIEGRQYRMKLIGIAQEKHCNPAMVRHLLELEYTAEADHDPETARVRLLVWVTEWSELPGLLRNALQRSLVEQQIAARVAPRRSRASRSWKDTPPPAVKSA